MNTPIDTARLDAELRALTDRALSPRSRYLHVALLLVASAMAALLAALLVTEPALPGPTSAAFATMLAIAIGWIVYALWVLRHRRPLLAEHRVVAGRMALVFSALFTAAALTVAMLRGDTMFWVAAGIGTGMSAIAMRVLVGAQRHARDLRARRDALLLALGGDQ